MASFPKYQNAKNTSEFISIIQQFCSFVCTINSFVCSFNKLILKRYFNEQRKVYCLVVKAFISLSSVSKIEQGDISLIQRNSIFEGVSIATRLSLSTYAQNTLKFFTFSLPTYLTFYCMSTSFFSRSILTNLSYSSFSNPSKIFDSLGLCFLTNYSFYYFISLYIFG